MVVYTPDINSKNAVIFLLTHGSTISIDSKRIHHGSGIGFSNNNITVYTNKKNDYRTFLCQISICVALIFVEPISIGIFTNKKRTFVMLYFLWQAV